MNIYQLIISRIKKGLFKHSEYDIFASSNGINISDVNEIKNIFKPELNEKVNSFQNFPSVVYSFSRLRSGSYFASKTFIKPEKPEESFIHVLVMEGYLPFYPIEILGSPAFMESIQEIKKGQKLLTLDSILPGQNISYETVSKFIRDNRGLYLKSMMDSLIGCEESRDSVSICDTAENLTLWIAALQMSLPVNLSHSISFTTNDLFKSQHYSVRGLLPDNTSDSCGNLFDCLKDVIPEVPCHFEFSNLSIKGFMESGEEMLKIKRFLEFLDHKNLDKNIDGAIALYKVCSPGDRELTPALLKSGFEFGTKHVSEDLLLDLYKNLEPSLQVLCRSVDLNSVEPFIDFIFKASLSSKDIKLVERTCYYLYASIDILAIKGSYDDLPRISELYKNTKDKFSSISHTIMQHSLTKERIAFLIALLSREELYNRSGFYLSMTLNNLIELGYTLSQGLKIEGMEQFIMQCCIHAAKDTVYLLGIIKAAGDSLEYFVNILSMLFGKLENRESIKIFIDSYISCIDKYDEKTSFSIRKRLCSLGLENLIFEECTERLQKSQNVSETFSKLQKEIIFELPEISSLYLSDIIKEYISLLSPDMLHAECRNILLNIVNNRYNIDDAALSLVISGFESSLTLSELNDEISDITPSIEKLKTSRNIKTSPDITGLLSFAFFVKEHRNDDYEIDDILSDSLTLEEFDKENYFAFIGLCLPYIIEYVKSPKDHRKIIRMFDVFDLDSEFLVLYINSIGSVVKSVSHRGHRALLHFIIYFFYYLEPRYKLQGDDSKAESIGTCLMNLLKELTLETIERMNQDISNEFIKMGVSLPVQWQEMYGMLTAQIKPSILGAAGILKSKGKRM